MGNCLIAGVASAVVRASETPNACLFVCLFVCLQVLLTNNKMIDKAFFYEFLHNWLGEGLLTSTGMLV